MAKISSDINVLVRHAGSYQENFGPVVWLWWPVEEATTRV